MGAANATPCEEPDAVFLFKNKQTNKHQVVFTLHHSDSATAESSLVGLKGRLPKLVSKNRISSGTEEFQFFFLL